MTFAVSRLVDASKPKKDERVIESDPERQKAREKYESMKKYELEKLLRKENWDPNGEKPQLVQRLLDKMHPVNGNADSGGYYQDSWSGEDHQTREYRRRYQGMDINQLRELCSENDLDYSGSKADLVQRELLLY